MMTATMMMENVAVPSRIDPESACLAVTDFLLDHVGNQLIVGEPHLMVSALRAVWIVPVYLTYIHTGPLGEVGVVAVDEETGQVVAWTPIPQMKAAGRKLRADQEPCLSKQFQALMEQDQALQP